MSSVMFLYCPYCESEFQTVMKEVGRFQTVTCKNCSKPFNLFTIFKTFYEEIPIAKRIAEIWSKSIYMNYEVTGPNIDDINIVNGLFDHNKFDKLFPQIVLDCNIYGNSFIKHIDNKGSVELTRIEPAFADVSTIQKGFDRLVNITTDTGDHISPDRLIHFTIDTTIDPPFCDPVYGLWFHFWYPLKLSPQLLLNASILKNSGLDSEILSDTEKLKEHFEREVKLGSGIPLSLFNNDMDEESFVGMGLFRHESNTKRRRLQNTVERQIYPLLLRRGWTRQFPIFTIQGSV